MDRIDRIKLLCAPFAPVADILKKSVSPPTEKEPCDHIYGMYIWISECGLIDGKEQKENHIKGLGLDYAEWFNFCPTCGEKLI